MPLSGIRFIRRSGVVMPSHISQFDDILGLQSSTEIFSHYLPSTIYRRYGHNRIQKP